MRMLSLDEMKRKRKKKRKKKSKQEKILCSRNNCMRKQANKKIDDTIFNDHDHHVVQNNARVRSELRKRDQ
jgi:hypothetical protein